MKLSVAPGVLAEIDSGSCAMETILADVFVLVTAAFALTLLPGLRGSERSIFSTRDKWAALFLRNGLLLLHAPPRRHGCTETGPNGNRSGITRLGTALILAIIQQARDRDGQTRAAASAEARVLQVRMNPHFLFNALNSLAVQSELAKGTTVTIRMPLRNSASTELTEVLYDMPSRASCQLLR